MSKVTYEVCGLDSFRNEVYEVFIDGVSVGSGYHMWEIHRIIEIESEKGESL